MKTEALYYVTSKKATFGIFVNENGIVVDGAPIAKKSIGRHIDIVTNYYKNVFNAKIIKCS